MAGSPLDLTQAAVLWRVWSGVSFTTRRHAVCQAQVVTGRGAERSPVGEEQPRPGMEVPRATHLLSRANFGSLCEVPFSLTPARSLPGTRGEPLGSVLGDSGNQYLREGTLGP